MFRMISPALIATSKELLYRSIALKIPNHIVPNATCSFHSKVENPTKSSVIITPPTTKLQKDDPSKVRTAKQVFNEVWSHIEQEYGPQNVCYPTDLHWLMGAPGSGKGANTPLILKARRITNPSICMSSLLTSPEMKKSMAQGKMIDDALVLRLLLRALLNRDPNDGVLIDGFPRTDTQVTFLKLFYARLVNLHEQHHNTSLANRYKKPSFNIMVLYVDEGISIARQLKRGKQIREHNEKAKKTGIGELLEERTTDFNEEIARMRYKLFMRNYGALAEVARDFPYHLVNASSSLDDVARQFSAFLNPKGDRGSHFNSTKSVNNRLDQSPPIQPNTITTPMLQGKTPMV